MLALIAGAGGLPAAVAAAQDTPPLICAFAGFPPDDLRSDHVFRLETLGSLMSWLREQGVTRICLCGHIRRPDIDMALLDDATLPLVPALRDALKMGDDGALRVVMGLFEEAGFSLIGAHEAAPDLVLAAGVPTRARPDDAARADAALGPAILTEMSRADLGQSCVIRAGRVLRREDEAGTDSMLARVTPTDGLQDDADDMFNRIVDTTSDLLGAAADWLSGPAGGDVRRNGILFKAPKPGQDHRADLPTIGPDTALAAIRAGLAGIVIEAEGVIVLDQPRVIALLDQAGLFLWVRERDG